MRIIHPRPKPGRQRALGVEFIDGVATVESLHPERELALLQHQFTIEKDLGVEAPFHAGLGEPIIDLNSLTIPQLRDLAAQKGIEIPPTARLKAEIIEAVSYAPADPIPGSIRNDDGSFTLVGVESLAEDAQKGPVATFELPDGTVLGDGTSIVTLHATEPDDSVEG